MSDARPITNVTDFVCSSCWNSFSRNQAGVDHGDHVVCPHCGQALVAARAGDVITAVNAAPTRPVQISDAFDAFSEPTLAGHGAPTHDSSPLQPANPVWFPPDLVGRSSEPAGFIVGEPDDVEDFDFNESTLRPDVSHEGLLQAVRTPTASPGLEALLAMEAATGPAPQVAGADSAAATEYNLAEDSAAEPRTPEERDWKLKAIGLTYNFHGLDALMGWASNKAGQSMQISMDGTVWRDFAVFFALHRAGVPASKAFEDAANPDALAELAAHPVVPNRLTNKKPAPELSGTGRESGVSSAAPARDSAAPRSSGTWPGKGNPPASASPSKRMPVAAAVPVKTADGKGGQRIAVVVAILVVLVLAGLAWKGILPLPGK